MSSIGARRAIFGLGAGGRNSIKPEDDADQTAPKPVSKGAWSIGTGVDERTCKRLIVPLDPELVAGPPGPPLHGLAARGGVGDAPQPAITIPQIPAAIPEARQPCR